MPDLTKFGPVTVKTAAGSIDVVGEILTTHFAMTPAFAANDDGTIQLRGGSLVLTHRPTGLAVTHGDWSLDPRRLATELEALPIDWSTFTGATADESVLVRGAFDRARTEEGDGWPWPEWAGDESTPALSLLAQTLDCAVDSWERYRTASDLGKEAKQHLPEDLGRKVDAHLIAGSSAITVNEYGVAYLLAVLHRVDPATADRAARDLAAAWDCGDTLGEWTHQWRRELGDGVPLTLHGFPYIAPELTEEAHRG